MSASRKAARRDPPSDAAARLALDTCVAVATTNSSTRADNHFVRSHDRGPRFDGRIPSPVLVVYVDDAAAAVRIDGARDSRREVRREVEKQDGAVLFVRGRFRIVDRVVEDGGEGQRRGRRLVGVGADDGSAPSPPKRAQTY